MFISYTLESAIMYIESVPNRLSPSAVLLRASYRDADKAKKRTLATLTKWPPALVQGLRTLLKDSVAVTRLAAAFDIVRILNPGAKLATARGLAPMETNTDVVMAAMGGRRQASSRDEGVLRRRPMGEPGG